jgi:sucrose phosphorylase
VNLQNKIMLVTYPDSLGKNLNELSIIVRSHLEGVVSGIHILPFYPSSADRGFSPIEYDSVDPQFGNWQDIEALALDHQLMFDFMLNHISRFSACYQDFLSYKDDSEYKGMFIRYATFWPHGEPSADDIDRIYKRKPRAPYVEAHFSDGTTEKIWCTFDEDQIDLNFRSDVTRAYIRKTITNLVQHGASIIRLDAFAYATKAVGTNCFFVEPEVWQILDEVNTIVSPFDATVLPEIHEHYSLQLKLAKRDFYVYDFALPMLILHALYSGTSEKLINWLHICPRKQFTTLDTHDGIGVVDVQGLLTEDEIEQTKNALFSKGANVKRIYNTTAYNNLDIYQINCTYYSALGERDDAYLLARALQYFTPGIPQVYYVGLLAGGNDIELLEKTKEGRNINRHYYTTQEIETCIHRPVVQDLFVLSRFRNNYSAFNGEFHILPMDVPGHIVLEWRQDSLRTTLHANLATRKFNITYIDPATGEEQTIHLKCMML